jgi:nucleolar pre-ribosomal-associated protein 1
VITSVFAAILALVSSHYTYHHLGQPIIRTLLAQKWIRKLNIHLGSQFNDLVLSTLKLYNSMSDFAGGKERRQVLESFPWESKVSTTV